ncbi:MAG: DcaP family trimeric outer membrane transporter [Gemmatimonadaceae bacterium]
MAGAQAQQGRPATRDTSWLEVFGFAQADAIFDFNQNNPDWFDVNRPTKLPAFKNEFGGDNRTWLSARQTRFGVKASIPTKRYDLKTVFDFDLFGVGVDAGQTTIRLRHAYGQWGPVGAGQLESPFMDLDVFPNILDYWGPNGMLFFRNVMVFYEPINNEKGFKAQIALERPGASGDGGRFADRIELQNIVARFPWPDLSAGVWYQDPKWGHVKLAGIVRSIRWDDVLADTLDLAGGTTGAGGSLSAFLKAGKNDVIRLQGVYGRGIQNYFNDAPIDIGVVTNPGNRRQPILGEALPVWGAVAFLDHNWNKVWSTSLGYSGVWIDNSNGQRPEDFHVGQYGTLNLLSQPIPNVMIGGELQWGQRRNFGPIDVNGNSFQVDDFRLQFSFKYSYSRKFEWEK